MLPESSWEFRGKLVDGFKVVYWAYATEMEEGAMLNGFHFRHTWFFAIFWFSAALVLANFGHYVLFRVLRRNEAAVKGFGWGLQRHLGSPARAPEHFSPYCE